MAEPLFLINVYIKNYSEKTVHKSIPVENTTKIKNRYGQNGPWLTKLPDS